MHLTSRSRDERGTTLLELMIVISLLSVVIWAAMSWLIEADRAVATSTDRAVNNTAAQSALDLLDSNLRFASSVSILGGSTLYVQNGDSNNTVEPLCVAWSEQNGDLVEQTTSNSAQATNIAPGVSGLSFSPSSSNYTGLVTVSFTLNQSTKDAESTGVPVIETLSAANMTGPVTSVTQAPCIP